MIEHHLNYRNEGDRYNGCIHTMAKYSRCLLWKRLCPKTRLRMKEAEVDVHGKKIRRRNILNNYNATINIDNCNNEVNKGPVQGTLSNWRKENEINTDENEKNLPKTKTDKILTSQHKNESVNEYKEKIRNFAKNYKEMNGVWFNIDDIEIVSKLYFI